MTSTGFCGGPYLSNLNITTVQFTHKGIIAGQKQHGILDTNYHKDQMMIAILSFPLLMRLKRYLEIKKYYDAENN